MRHEHVPRDFKEHDKGIDSVVSIHDEIEVVAPPVNRTPSHVTFSRVSPHS